MEKPIVVRFVNVDNWNRPVFRQVDKKIYYGSVDKLFPYEESEEGVLKYVTSADLEYFGHSFGCEPMGGLPSAEIIIERKGSETIN